ncbi:perilipin-3-like [Parus major]|uniref:perilipin-3-like n=1 Tax=Parus major TaxID=9157 RepID=UPI0007712DA6|nr:perilipin-3-like [Parus major]
MSAENAAVPGEAGPETKSVVTRVANLALVSCACGAVASAYGRTKESHPCVRSVCDAAERGVRTLTAAAASGAQPLLTRLEPQISTANKLACKGLDKLEEKLPILQQPPERVVAGTRELVSGTVSGAVARTRSALGAMVGTRVGQLLATGVGAVLGKSEELLDRHRPGTDGELAAAAGTEVTRGTEVEARTLAMLHGLLHQLHSACSHLAAGARAFPSSVQETAGHVRHGVEGVQASLASARSFQDLSGLVLAQSRDAVTRAQLSLEGLLEHVGQHTPLPWLVGPFAPALVEYPEDVPVDMSKWEGCVTAGGTHRVPAAPQLCSQH